MWNSEDIIRIELGANIVEAANSPDTRNIFARTFGMPPKDDAKLILEGIMFIRNNLSKRKIFFPSIKLTDNNSIGGNDFISYWGIEKEHFSISCLNDLFDFIRNKAIEYTTSKEVVSLRGAFSLVKEGDYQKAYKQYLRLYYNTRIRNDFYNSARILTEVSCLMVNSGQVDLAIQYSLASVNWIELPNIVDPILKCQVYLNTASICKVCDTDLAIKYFNKCMYIAYTTNNEQFLFFSLLGLAEVFSTIGLIEDAIKYYNNALKLVDNADVTCIIQKEMIRLYEYICMHKTSPIEESNIKSKFRNLLMHIATAICSRICETALIKCLSICGFGAIVSIGTKYVIKGNIFNSPVVLGKGNVLNS